MIPVVISGGSGTRLWPLSRMKHPKQFCNLTGESLLTTTLRRVSPFGSPWILTTKELASGSQQALRASGFTPEAVIAEPFGRNTAPAIALACHLFQTRGWGHEIAGIFPADHLVLNTPAFRKAVSLASEKAQQGTVVTLGIRPTYPATGYGYIELSEAASANDTETRAYDVQGFREKPNLETAKGFVASGSFMWNAGIFVFQVDKMAEHFARLMPELWQAIQQVKPDLSNVESIYRELKSISVDYGIMEHLKDQACVPCDIGWNDLGSWDDVADVLSQNPSPLNLAEVVAPRSRGNFVYSSSKKVVGLVGVENLMIVETDDALLVARKGMGQDVRDVVEELKKRGHPAASEHTFEERPWGRFEILRDEGHYKSKKITVHPGAQLSYQSHDKRAEHWIIVRGHGEVVLNDEIIKVGPGSAVFIPLQAKHRMRNTGSEPLEFIEVQTGQYFGEDDIVRYSDDYKRA